MYVIHVVTLDESKNVSKEYVPREEDSCLYLKGCQGEGVKLNLADGLN